MTRINSAAGKRERRARPLDEKAAAERAPLPPDVLIDAMNGRGHRDDLLRDVTEDNLHGEIGTGPSVGGEVW